MSASRELVCTFDRTVIRHASRFGNGIFGISGVRAHVRTCMCRTVADLPQDSVAAGLVPDLLLGSLHNHNLHIFRQLLHRRVGIDHETADVLRHFSEFHQAPELDHVCATLRRAENCTGLEVFNEFKHWLDLLEHVETCILGIWTQQPANVETATVNDLDLRWVLEEAETWADDENPFAAPIRRHWCWWAVFEQNLPPHCLIIASSFTECFHCASFRCILR